MVCIGGTMPCYHQCKKCKQYAENIDPEDCIADGVVWADLPECIMGFYPHQMQSCKYFETIKERGIIPFLEKNNE